MRFISSILLIFSLLLQAWPAQVVRVEDKPKCMMSCCASLAREELASCGCAKDEPLPPEPASTPPLSGRELVPQVVWETSAQAENAIQHPPAKLVIVPQDHEPGDLAQPHVRLPVLFCSILI